MIESIPAMGAIVIGALPQIIQAISIPAMGAIEFALTLNRTYGVSIPATGGNRKG